ncbi:MAG: PAS domain S-box protein [Spirulina sp. SIO3F2]|nr:PAS domain S-box protein [Spirulina sp. SIO3F2]
MDSALPAPANVVAMLGQSSLMAIMETSPVGIFYTDDRNQCLYANPQFCILTGLGLSELQRQGWLRAVHPEDAQRVRQEWHTAQTTGQWFQSEYRFLRPDGSVRWVYSQAQANQDETMLSSGYVGSCTDITKRKQTETELRRYQQAVESASDAIAITDAEGQIVYVNSAWVALHHSPTAAVFHNRSLGHFLSDPIAFQGIFSTVMVGQAWQHELEFTDHQNNLIPVFLRVSPILNPPHQVTGLVCIATDISEHKRIESKLRQFTERLQQQIEREQLLNQLSNQIRHSLETPITEIITLAIAEIRNLLNIDRTQFAWYKPEMSSTTWRVAAEYSTPDLVLHSPVEAARQWQALTPQLLRHETVQLEATEVMTESQQQLLRELGYGALLIIPLIIQHEVIGAIICGHSTPRLWSDPEVLLIQAVVDQLAIATNQTRLYTETQAKAKELEQALYELGHTQTQLIQTEKMSSLGQLVAGVAHEINNPVNFISGNVTHAHGYITDLLELIDCYQQEYPSPSSAILETQAAIELDFLQADLPDLFRSMQVGVDRIKEIVASLRIFSRMDEAEMKAVNLHEGIESTLMILHNRIKATGGRPVIKVVRHYGELPQIECYAGQLNQVFMNLLSNAIDALEDTPVQTTPTIEITTRCLPNYQVEIQFQDNAGGIPAKLLPRLFDPFFTTKEIGKGTGLGLSISYQIVTERHGGRLVCESEVGVGTRFTVTIPIMQMSAEVA